MDLHSPWIQDFLLPAHDSPGTMAGSGGNCEGMVSGRKHSSDHTTKPCAVRLQEQTKRESTGSRELAMHLEDSGNSNEDIEPCEDPPTISAMELSVLERLGLHRVALTEQDVEAAFAHLALAFRCDMFTLRQRVQIEERARDAAEENIQQELAECRTMLQKLGEVCLDSRCMELVEQLKICVTVLARVIERATVTAEKLGAVHQEARLSRATEVMVQHVENLKRHHQREHTELEEMKRLIQQNSRNRQLAENRDDGDHRLKHPPIRTFQQGSVRRRISIAVVPKQLTQFHSPARGRSSEGEAIQPTAGEQESPERQLPCLQEDSTDSYFILHTGSSSSSHQSLHGPNNIEFGMDRSHCTEGKESEFRKRSTIGKTDEEEPSEESDSEGLDEENEELEQNALVSKGSKMELCRAWFSMPTYYWVLLWLFFLGIACLVLIRIMEMQKQYPFPSSNT
ncbi:inositol 1,4,5-triphosphate receptor associated 1-like [Eublepharis macularius]|uniref:Inositol 1,4,5-triphosphate receptor associated 1-like n=1 Tax=Eublepharis macularius TaxID=481883 RepID=A0AA97JFG4_EUBMA|nr:inositol 1,4,5-triphosphate receptor associated 1-like [Eublepharis macularius]